MPTATYTSMPTFGDLKDNVAAHSIALHLIATGDEEAGRNILCELRNFINTTGEVQSTKWLLPSIEDVLRHTLTHVAT